MTIPEPDPGYGPANLATDATLAALALLRTRAGAADTGTAIGAQFELVDSWTDRFGEGGLRVLLAAVVEQAQLLVGDPEGADARLAAAEMAVLAVGLTGDGPDL
ncbi:hypothetical protein ACGFX4_38440 [Kitasatospora sp. NPDC048365]|uniref:hypothetical protein n=1 Tax=Kitasatospora sp. NPDC048365 TaxID=3364050 RepID=UPI00371CB3E7